MVFQRLPKITKIEGGTTEIESPFFLLDNFEAVAFLVDNADSNNLTITTKAKRGEDGEAIAVPFRFKAASDAEFSTKTFDERTITTSGAFIAAVTAPSIGRGEYDRVAITIESDGDVGTVYALQVQPRYANNE